MKTLQYIPVKNRENFFKNLFYILGASYVTLLGLTQPAYSLDPEGEFGNFTSKEAYKICREKKIGNIAECIAAALYVDPPSAEYTDINLILNYDSSKWTFRPDLSGPLCSFAVGGDCPPPNAAIGTFPLLDHTVTLGTPLPASTLNFNDDPINGLVKVNYSLATPVLITENQNFLSLYFDAKKPFSPDSATVTYYSESGDYDFSEQSSVCTTTEFVSSCASTTPVAGLDIDVTSIPESFSPLPLIALGILGSGAIVKRHLNSTKTAKQQRERNSSDTHQQEVSKVS